MVHVVLTAYSSSPPKAEKIQPVKQVLPTMVLYGVSKLSKQLDLMDPYNFVLWAYERAKYTENATDTGVAAQYIRKMSNYDTIAKTIPELCST
jgi:hypothetical protein